MLSRELLIFVIVLWKIDFIDSLRGDYMARLTSYDNEMYEWYVVNGKFLNKLEPLRCHPLEDYIEKE